MYIVYETERDSSPPAVNPMTDWGWDEFFERTFAILGSPADDLADRPAGDDGLVAARVIEVRRGSYLVSRPDGGNAAVEDEAVLSGNAMGRLAAEGDAPAVGDWLAGRKTEGGPFVVAAILPRKTAIARKAPGDTGHDKVERQVLAANVDTAFLVCAAGEDFNPRRIERYAAVIRESGVEPVVVVTKADLAGDGILDLVARASAACPGAPAFAVSARDGRGMAAFERCLVPGKTVVLLGSSGSGKSTLLNALAGRELAATREVKAYDQRGRHTTTARTLYRLPSGALVIDTPGLRELQLWADGGGVDSVFPEIEETAASCRFPDCSHGVEPGCAVRAAVEAGTIDAERWESWKKLKRELAFLETRMDPKAMREQKAEWKRRNRRIKEIQRQRR